MSSPLDCILLALFFVLCFVLMGVGVCTLAQMFVQDFIDRHERQHHRRADHTATPNQTTAPK